MTDTSTETKTFADFGVADDICEALAGAGITNPFPIQELTLPLGLAGADVIGQARTGTGKTLAFGIPLLHRVRDDRSTQALVIVPTRELCLQVRDDLDRASARRGTRVVPVYGGKSIDAQADAIRKGAPVIVGTPGRLLDLLRRGILDLSTVTSLVLDEADEMLDLGFLPDVETLIEACATDRQTLLFSATMPSAVVALARRYMRKPTFLRAEVEEARIAPETEQHFFSCHRMDKPAVLARILQTPGRGLCVVFTRTKRMADVLASELRERGIVAAPIHSDLRQEARERAMEKFRKGTIDVLVATEVAARGLDISDVTHVVNYDCPDDEKMYLHRIGRTGRAGGSGVAITLAVWNELARMEMIKKALDIEVPTHEVFSTSPILDELFDLPARAPRRSPAGERAPERGQRRAPERGQRSAPDRGERSGKKRARREPRDGNAADDQAQGTPPAPSPASPPSDADTEPGQRIRTRRRRSRRGGEQDEQPATPAAASAPAAAPTASAAAAPAAAPGQAAAPASEQDDSRGVRRRVRTRVRADGASRPARGTPRDAGEETPRDAGEEPSADGTARPRPVRSRSRRRPSSGTAAPKARKRAEEDASGGRPAPRSRRGRPRSDRDAPRRTERVSTSAARGSGKPGLHRPMVVTHLP